MAIRRYFYSVAKNIFPPNPGVAILRGYLGRFVAISLLFLLVTMPAPTEPNRIAIRINPGSEIGSNLILIVHIDVV